MSTIARRPLWSEGMFLTPQHLQMLMRHLDTRFADCSLGSRSFAWGLSRLEIDEGALGNYQFSIRALEGELDDGTRIRVPHEARVPSRDLREVLETNPHPVTVYLAIPELKEGAANLAEEGGIRRYQKDVHNEVVDENTGRDPRPLEYSLLTARILLENEDMDGYQVLPIARVKIVETGKPVPILDPTFIPPVNRVSAFPPLQQRVDFLAQQIVQKSRTLGDEMLHQRATFTDEGGAQNWFRLYTINSSLRVFEILTQTPDVHPYDVYLHVARLVGELGTFQENRRVPPELPPYNPRNLGGTLEVAIAEAVRLLNESVPTNFETAAFKPEPPFEMEGAVDGQFCQCQPEWTEKRDGIYLGVFTELDRNEVEAHVNALKLCMHEDRRTIEDQLLRGLGRTLLPEDAVHVLLPRRAGLHYFKVHVEEPLWHPTASNLIVLFGGDHTNPNYQFTLYVVNPIVV